jgi:hypothetical protein
MQTRIRNLIFLGVFTNLRICIGLREISRYLRKMEKNNHPKNAMGKGYTLGGVGADLSALCE